MVSHCIDIAYLIRGICFPKALGAKSSRNVQDKRGRCEVYVMTFIAVACDFYKFLKNFRLF